MHETEHSCWYTEHGYEISVHDIKHQLGNHIANSGKLFISCSSRIVEHKLVFSSALCLYGRPQEEEQTFVYHRNLSTSKFDNTNQRMFKEAYNALGVALWIADDFPHADIEIQIDLSSNDQAEHFRQTFSQMIENAGFDFSVS